MGTKGQIRAARKAARQAGRAFVGELALTGETVPGYARVRTRAEESRHADRMDRWARRYDDRNGAPESDGDR